MTGCIVVIIFLFFALPGTWVPGEFLVKDIFITKILFKSHLYIQAAVDSSDDETCRTFVMHNEDHTLGNALRYIIMKK